MPVLELQTESTQQVFLCVWHLLLNIVTVTHIACCSPSLISITALYCRNNNYFCVVEGILVICSFGLLQIVCLQTVLCPSVHRRWQWMMGQSMSSASYFGEKIFRFPKCLSQFTCHPAASEVFQLHPTLDIAFLFIFQKCRWVSRYQFAFPWWLMKLNTFYYV